jgi:hypothetical protein
VLLPSRRIGAILKRPNQFHTLAGGLGAVLLREDRELTEGITERNQRESVGLAQRTWSALAARMKSFSERPPIEWVESSTRTFPQVKQMSGWWPSASATSPRRLT